MTRILEIAVFNLQAALIAATAGADRLELCENVADGGTTPSYGTLMQVRKKVTIPVFPIIRPRGGDFVYNEDEWETILHDVMLVKQLGFEGIVSGGLLPDGNIDTNNTRRLVDAAYPMDVTFHRAFDRCIDPLEGLENIISCGCNRILTSGQKPLATDGMDLIKKLVKLADDRIIIMPGSGVRGDNIIELTVETGAVELHSSAKIIMPSPHFNKTEMEEELKNIYVDSNEIKMMKKALHSLK